MGKTGNPSNQWFYEGEMENGWPNGQGVIKSPNGEYVYSGNFEMGVSTGYGIETFKNGQRYEGYFKDNKPNGEGTLNFSGEWEGDRIVGEFKDGKADGEAVYYFKDGRKYVGIFKEGEFVSGEELNSNGIVLRRKNLEPG